MGSVQICAAGTMDTGVHVARIDSMAGPSAGSYHQAASHTTTVTAEGQSSIALPDIHAIAQADLSRDGDNLILTAHDGSKIIIENYFNAEPVPTLTTAQGSLTPELVKSFVHDAHDVRVAGIETANDASPVGTIKEVSGHATVTHPDGTVETAVTGMPIHEGDIIQTDAKGAVNLVFIDESSFAVSENAKLAIDKYVFDPESHSGDSNFSMLRGLFVYTSGLIGREDPDDVKIHTPVGSIGIRGTVIAGNVDKGEITVVEGAIVLHSLDGKDMTLANQYETARFTANGIDYGGTLTAADLGAKFSSIGGVAAAFFSGLTGGSDNAPARNAEPAAKPDTPAQGHDSHGTDTHSQTDAQPATAPSMIADIGPASNVFTSAPVFGNDSVFAPPAALANPVQSAVAPTQGLAATVPPSIIQTAAPALAVEITQPVATQPAPPAPVQQPVSPVVYNTAPVTTDSTFTIAENLVTGTNVGQFIATDPDAGQTLTYSIVGGNVNGAFAIDSNTGVITVAGPVDFETSPVFSLIVAATDSGAGHMTATGTVTVNVTNVNDAPSIANQTFVVAEDAASGTQFGTVIATDQDAGQTITYSMTGGGGLFVIDSATGKIKTTGLLDRESVSSYTLTVTASDNAGTPLSSSATITVQVGDVNDTTPNLAGGTFNINENAAAGTSVLTASATDPDTTGTLSYSIISGNVGNAFTIDSATGVLSVAAGAVIDYETLASYNLTIQVSDGIHTFSNTFAINVNDLAEPLSLNTLSTGQGFTISDQSNKQLGFTATAIGDANGDGYDDVLLGNAVNNQILDLTGQASRASSSSTALSGFNAILGGTVTNVATSVVGDFNGDGVRDIVVGSYTANDANGTIGTGHAVIMDYTGNVITKIDGLTAGEMAGLSVSGAGDVNRDGYADVLVGAPGADNNGTDAGRAYLLFGHGPVALNTVVDVGNLNSGHIVGSVSPNNPSDLLIKGNLSFVLSATGASLEIFDITDPTAPVAKGTITSSDIITATSGTVMDGLDNADTMVIKGNYALITGAASGRLTVIDISNPISPTYVTSVLLGIADVKNLAINGNKLIATSATNDSIVLVDVSDPSSPILGQTYNHAGALADPTGVALSSNGNFAYVSSSNQVEVVNVTTGTPAFASLLNPSGMTGIADVLVSGNLLFITAAATGKLFVYDISDPGNPAFVNSFSDTSLMGASGLAIANNMAYISSATGNSVTTIDIHDLNSMVKVNVYVNNANLDGAADLVIDANGLVHVAAQGSGIYAVLDTLPDGLVINGLAANAMAGATVTRLGDYNGDGYDDFAVASPNGGNGRIDVVFGRPGMTAVTLGTDSMAFTNIATDISDVGIPIQYAGDMNGDGISDLIFAATNANSGNGLGYVVYGNTAFAAGGVTDVAAMTLNGTNGYVIDTGTKSIIGAGAVGDYNGDGYDDAVIVVKDAGSFNVDLYVMYGHNAGASDGVMNMADLNNAANAFHMTYAIPGTVANPDNFDFVINGAGDLNGDGFADFIVGLPNKDNNTSVNSSGTGGAADDNDGSAIAVYGQNTTGSITDGSAGDGNATANNVTASANQQSIVGNANANSLSDGGLTGIAFSAGGGNDTIGIGNANFRTIDGGAGTDILRFMQNTGTLDFGNLHGEMVTRIENIQMSGNTQTISLTLDNIFAMLNSSDTGDLRFSENGGSNHTLVIDNQNAGSQTGASAASIGAMLGNVQVTDQSTYYAFDMGGGHTLSIDKALVDGGHVNVA